MSCRVGITKLAALGAVVLPMAAASVEVAAEEVTVKLWSRADRSGPLRTGNIVAAAEPVNAVLKAAGSDTMVRVEAFDSPATCSRRSRSGRAPTSTSPRTSGSASSSGPATR